ncbi:MAG TPA: YdcF family protein [Verrucomicrobiae bacterium]|nr:YdcF family protein [Verrucomicrobiae bacterium]
MNETAIIVLGAPNDERGVLSSIAIERCQQAVQEYRKHPESKIIPTGGWGEHFNTTSQPHGHYLAAYLQAQQIPAGAFVECAESSNTIEDAKLCRPIVERHGFRKLIVVTSDFHRARAQFLFTREFPDILIEFSVSKTNLPELELKKRVLHEQAALAKLKQ